MEMIAKTDCSWSHNTDTAALHSIVQYTELAGMTLVEVMGYTAHAFRIIIDPEAVEVGSYSHFDWKLNHEEALNNLGFSVQYAGKQTNIPPTPEELEEGIQLVQQAIDRGIPALSWDLFIPEWGVIYGYDDNRRVFQCRDVRQDAELPYEKLGRGEVTELYVLGISGYQPVSRRAMLRGALELALRHAEEILPGLEKSKHRNGIAAYDAWIKAFTNRTVEAFGNSVNTVKVWDAREFAVKFLEDVVANWPNEKDRDSSQLRQLASEAAAHYRIVADRLGALVSLFPFPQGGEPNQEAVASRSIELLQDAKAAEVQGVRVLEQMLESLD
ncbi:hypothetical protein [Paenibacillus lignilyticus]|uniref:Uncharacterized protein n=1 Tax=Paenibacillus lignilyticus TaxID=1172615 RepID=A0ABS5CDB5_9BACL|nr:hypothetical protein [Paenibacillus lignilyticus]MBP3963918.1 hypothetical protein [Paenibacillus lignilyticus]